ncbi:MAG: hypothetical protein ACR2QC_07970 [Gammaproteobacteria bacterium]
MSDFVGALRKIRSLRASFAPLLDIEETLDVAVRAERELDQLNQRLIELRRESEGLAKSVAEAKVGLARRNREIAEELAKTERTAGNERRRLAAEIAALQARLTETMATGEAEQRKRSDELRRQNADLVAERDQLRNQVGDARRSLERIQQDAGRLVARTG